MWGAIGILESMWHLTARQAARGDIGKLSNEEIALGIDYYEDADKLVSALVESGLLDVNTEHRYIVHDWSEHADDYINVRLARAVEHFADGKRPNIKKLGLSERSRIEDLYAEKESTGANLCAQKPHESAQKPPSLLPLPLPLPLPQESTNVPSCDGASESENVAPQEEVNIEGEITVIVSALLQGYKHNPAPKKGQVKNALLRAADQGQITVYGDAKAICNALREKTWGVPDEDPTAYVIGAIRRQSFWDELAGSPTVPPPPALPRCSPVPAPAPPAAPSSAFPPAVERWNAVVEDKFKVKYWDRTSPIADLREAEKLPRFSDNIEEIAQRCQDYERHGITGMSFDTLFMTVKGMPKWVRVLDGFFDGMKKTASTSPIGELQAAVRRVAKERGITLTGDRNNAAA
jgi:hypothetical protein